MEDVCETLLYIAYNLENQNQIITIDAIRRSLRWLFFKITGCDIKR